MIEAFFSTISWGWISLAVGFVASGIILGVSYSVPFFKRSRLRKEGERTSFSPLNYRLGGVALIISFWLSWYIDGRVVSSPGLTALLSGSLLILVVGSFDDWRPIPWWGQLFFQGILGALLVSFGLSVDLMQGVGGGTIDFRTWAPWVPGAILFLWLILILNALNWLDGLDGLLGSISLIGFLTLFIVSIFPEVHQPAISLLSLALFGGTFAFLLFNWSPARIIAGTSGAYFLGFALVVLSVMAGAKVATTLLVLTIPIVDALYVIVVRWRTGKSIFLPDRNHLHHRLAELGWTPRAITILYGFLTCVMAILALTVEGVGKLLVFCIGGGVTLLVSVWMTKTLKQGIKRLA